MTGSRALPRPDRVRTVERPFGWVPCRMLTNGTIASMSPDERQLYLVLALAADRQGVSFYGDKRIARILACTQQELELARHALMARELVAYDGATYQLLPLPSDAATTPSASQYRDPAASETATIPATRTQPLSRPRTPTIDPQREHGMPESVRHILRDIFDRERF
jgi:hypothetical protein